MMRDKKKEEILGIIFKVENNSKKGNTFLHFMNLRLPIRKVQDLKNIITLIALLVKS